jgi:branched-subunit amino acid aminotransferase/4-amino-4-deoxychorismate lyase
MNVFPTAWYRGEIVPTESLPIQPAWEPWGVESEGVFTTTRTFQEHGRLAFWQSHAIRLVVASMSLKNCDNAHAILDRSTFPQWHESLGQEACIRINVLAKSIRPYMIWAVAKPLPPTPMPTKLAFSSEPATSDRRLKLVAQDWRRNAENEANAKGAWDVVALGPDGTIRDASKANILVRNGSSWFTPRADGLLLPGVVRHALLVQKLVEERPVTVAELLAADEVVCTNSVRGIVPIHEVEGRTFTPGEATKKLQEWFEKAAVAHAG